MKVIAYAIFGNPSSFEFNFYLRGIYFNSRMNRLIYPDWQTWVYVQDTVYNRYESYFNGLAIDRVEVLGEAPLCESMLWRLRPIFADGVSHLLCRDADAITTYKEAQAVQEWVDSGLGFHGITDNPAHTLPMMGGMIGIKPKQFFDLFYKQHNLLLKLTFDRLIQGFDLSKRGSDQDLLIRLIYPWVKNEDMMGHFFEGCKEKVRVTTMSVHSKPPLVDPRLWESNLTCRHIGSAGVIDMEVLRFFKRFDETDYSEFERLHSDILYWSR